MVRAPGVAADHRDHELPAGLDRARVAGSSPGAVSQGRRSRRPMRSLRDDSRAVTATDPLPAPLRRALSRVFELDLRALAALRIAAGLLLLASLADRARAFRAFYTDDGPLTLAD